MQFVLPKLLFPRLVEKRKIANMVHEDVAEDGKLRIQRGDFAIVGLEGGAESSECGGRVEFMYFVLDLL